MRTGTLSLNNPAITELSEYSATGYSRQAVSWGSVSITPPSGSDGAYATVSNSSPIVFGPFTAGTGATITGVSLVTAASGTSGEVLLDLPLTTSLTPTTGDTVQFATGQFAAVLQARSPGSGDVGTQLTADGLTLGLQAALGISTATARTTYLALVTSQPSYDTSMASLPEYSAAGYSRPTPSFVNQSGSGNDITTFFEMPGFVTFGTPTSGTDASLYGIALVTSASGTSGQCLMVWEEQSATSPTLRVGVDVRLTFLQLEISP